MATDTQSVEQLLELKRDELNKLAAEAGVADAEQLPNKAAVAEAIANATAATPSEPQDDAGDDENGGDSQEPGDEPEDDSAPDEHPPPTEEQVGEPNDTSSPSGESATVTYLGRPEMIARDEEGNAVEEDVYQGTDPWEDNRPLTIGVGESARVSAEKAAQLDADFPGAFELS